MPRGPLHPIVLVAGHRPRGRNTRHQAKGCKRRSCRGESKGEEFIFQVSLLGIFRSENDILNKLSRLQDL